MKITSDNSFKQFNAWSGAVETQAKIIEEGKDELFESVIEDLYPDGMTDTQLNDLLWFDSDTVYEWLGITEESDDGESDEE